MTLAAFGGILMAGMIAWAVLSLLLNSRIFGALLFFGLPMLLILALVRLLVAGP